MSFDPFPYHVPILKPVIVVLLMPVTSLITAYNRGKQAYHQGHSLIANPYRWWSWVRRVLWLEGWCTEQHKKVMAIYNKPIVKKGH